MKTNHLTALDVLPSQGQHAMGEGILFGERLPDGPSIAADRVLLVVSLGGVGFGFGC